MEDIKLDLGHVKISRNVVEQLIAKSLKDITGVHLIKPTLSDKIKEALGYVKQPGIGIKVDDEQELSLEVAVNIDYGINIPDVARKIQDIVKQDVKKALDITVKDINVEIEGIERG